MSEENKINQPVEDVFSSVDETNNAPKAPVSEDLNISEASIGQEEPITPVQKEEVVSESQIDQTPIEENKKFSTNKILFYLLMALIIVLGAFAIWALAF